MSLSQPPQSPPKRLHDCIDSMEVQQSTPDTSPPVQNGTQQPSSTESGGAGVHTPKRAMSPAISDISELTEPSSITPIKFGIDSLDAIISDRNGAPGGGSQQPPAKRVKLTFAEKEIKRIEKEFREKEKEAERKRKEAERAEHQAEKARKEAEKEKERKRKEAEREEKRIAQEKEKAAKEEKRKQREEEKRQKEEEKRRKEEEKQRIEEEKRKKAGNQKTLGSFFNISATPKSNAVRERLSASPAPSAPASASAVQSPAHPTPSKVKEQSTYEKLFPDFFVQNNVTLAAGNRWERDAAALEATEARIDSCLQGNASPYEVPLKFNAVELFHLRGKNLKPRGKRVIPMREIMGGHIGNASRPIDLTAESKQSQMKNITELLKSVPVKFLKFREDVRPPYCGTYTSEPVSGMSRLARNPLRRDLPNMNYDYDSEAEWVEDEDAEDLDSDGEEEEDLGDDGDDMDGFLDDENDEKPIRRLVPQGDLEPVSSGLCWEDESGRNSNVQMISYRMEFMLDPKIRSIDPFSTEYWQKPATKEVKAMEPPRLPLQAMKSNNVLSSNKPVKMFGLSDSLKSAGAKTDGAPSADTKPKKLLPAQDLDSFKREVQGSDLSKVGLIEVLTKKFPGRPKAAIKGTLESIAKRVGSKEAEKRWVIIEE